MNKTKSPYRAFRMQKRQAGKRGINWEFTFEEWLAWWEKHLGENWMELRGAKLGQYVMARKRDIGPYHVSNVDCVTCSENHIARRKQLDDFVDPQRKHKYHKLCAREAREIYLMAGTQKSIASKFGVSARNVRMIKNKVIWQHVNNVSSG